MSRNAIIGLLTLLILIVAAIFYHQSSANDRLYAQFSAGETRLLPSFRTRSAGGKEVKDEYRLISESIENQDYFTALSMLHPIITNDPGNLTLQLYSGILAKKNGQYDEAIGHFQTIRMNSDLYYEESLKRLSLIYLKIGQVQKAIQMLDDLIAVSADHNLNWAREFRKSLTY